MIFLCFTMIFKNYLKGNLTGLRKLYMPWGYVVQLG
jgi:hypothetical protein